MFSHIFVGVNHFDRALAFYNAVMASLGFEQRFCEPTVPWAGWHSEGGARPFFVIGKPSDGHSHQPGNGQMVAFAASDRGMVRVVHNTALAAGGRCEGPPGVRPQYHRDYFGAYFRDPEGNKLCVACHRPEHDE